MPESRLDRINAAREEFKDVIKAKEENGDNARFTYLKFKSSQSGLTVTNSVSIGDQVSETKYVVSVNAVVSGNGASPEMLTDLQSAIAKFLMNLHESI